MPSANNKTKMTGDMHLPDAESEFDTQEANPQGTGDVKGQQSDRGRKTELGHEGDAGRGGNKAGILKDREAPTSDSYGNTRDSGEPRSR